MLKSSFPDSLRALRSFKISAGSRSSKAVFGLAVGAVLGGAVSVAAQTITSPRPVARPAVESSIAGAASTLALNGTAQSASASLAGVVTTQNAGETAGPKTVQAPSLNQSWGLQSSSYPRARPKDFHKRAIRSGADLVADAGVSGDISYAVADLQAGARGEVLEARAPARRMPPASVAKAITAIYALEHLGGDYRFATDLLATGGIENGIVQGDLILSGSGDPTLDSDHLHALAVQLKQAGVTGVTGQFYVYDGALPRIETIDHEQTEYASYNPSITGLNVNYNRVHFEWRKQGADYSFKMDGRTDNRAPRVSVARMRIADRGAPVFDHTAGPNRDDWTVSRGALGNAGSRWLPVRVPSLYVAELFGTLAKAQGVNLPAGKRLATLPPSTLRVTRHESDTLTVIARDMLKFSTNLTAEVIGMAASKARGVRVTDLKSSAAAMSDWAQTRLDTRHLQFKDHSGLSGASVVSTSDMVRLLAAPGVEPLLAPILKPIAVLDSERRVIKNSGISIAAKTGTLDFVSTLAGYVTAPDGRPMAFAIFTGDLPRRKAAKAAGEAVPKGARTFNTRAKKLQQVLLQRWAAYYGA